MIWMPLILTIRIISFGSDRFIFFLCLFRPPPSPSGTISSGYGQSQSRSVPIYEMKFPDLCVY